LKNVKLDSFPGAVKRMAAKKLLVFLTETAPKFLMKKAVIRKATQCKR
jgi:hypothetical protein